MDNGDILVSEIGGSSISRITRVGKMACSKRAPGVRYPSDDFPNFDGKQVIVADFSKQSRVVIFDPTPGKKSWQDFAAGGDRVPEHLSLSRELPDSGDIIVADDLRERVIVIDRKTKEIIWQYGVSDTKGHAPGLLT